MSTQQLRTMARPLTSAHWTVITTIERGRYE
jgi:hypothetical protein